VKWYCSPDMGPRRKEKEKLAKHNEEMYSRKGVAQSRVAVLESDACNSTGQKSMECNFGSLMHYSGTRS